MTSLPPPGVMLGIPKYTSWYPGQKETFLCVVDWFHGSRRFLGLSVPAGAGKSLTAIMVAKLLNTRACFLTVTKGLQEQYLKDIAPLGGVNIMGRNNYLCALVPGLTTEEGPCRDGLSCSFRDNDCSYYQQLARATVAPIVVTNYAYYLAQTRFSSGLGDFGLLVLDESHLTFGALENHLSIRLSHLDVESMGIAFPQQNQDWLAWQEWAEDNKPVAESVVNKLERDIRSLRNSGSPVSGALSHSFRIARSVVVRLSSIEDATGRWITNYQRRGWNFTPVWVSQYGDAVYRNIPKVILMSALLSTKTLDILGVPVNRDMFTTNSHFPPSNTPIYHVSTSQINHRSDDFKLTIWLSRIDQIIQRRLDRKGIIFTVSYDRAHLILRSSRFAYLMLSHSTGDVVQVVRKFKAADSPAILISPAITSGWDIPEADYIIVAKIPYPDTTGVVMKARKEEDKDWPAFLAMETLVNESGRGTRSISDRCEVLIIDDNWKWFLPRYKQFAPEWFQARVRGSLSVVPEPLV